MVEGKRYTMDPSDMPDYVRGLANLLFLLQGEKPIDGMPDDTLFFLSSSLDYFADDLEAATEKSVKAECELYQLKKRMEVKTA